MWSSDYPHPVTSWPRSREVVEKQFHSIPQDERELILSGNAIRVWNTVELGKIASAPRSSNGHDLEARQLDRIAAARRPRIRRALGGSYARRCRHERPRPVSVTRGRPSVIDVDWRWRRPGAIGYASIFSRQTDLESEPASLGAAFPAVESVVGTSTWPSPVRTDAFSMARYLAAGGDLVVTVDPPGVGESDAPDDGYTLSPCTWSPTSWPPPIQAIEADLECDGVDEGGERGRAVVQGQNRPGSFRRSAARRLPAGSSSFLRCPGTARIFRLGPPRSAQRRRTPICRTDRRSWPRSVARPVARARFGDPLPQWSNRRAGELEPSSAAAGGRRWRCAAASSRLLALVGMTAIVPGIGAARSSTNFGVPIFVALGEHDLAGRLDVLPGQLPACRDLTLFRLEGAGHNHNVAPNRQILWKRVMRWANSVAPDYVVGSSIRRDRQWERGDRSRVLR